MRKINQIIIHHTASPRDTTTLSQISDWHREKFGAAYDGKPGYHYVILGSGITCKTRPNCEVGMHAFGSNANSIGIALTGNFMYEKPADFQITVLKDLVKELKDAYGPLKVVGHRDTWWAKIKPTLCPGDNLYAIVREGV